MKQHTINIILIKVNICITVQVQNQIQDALNATKLRIEKRHYHANQRVLKIEQRMEEVKL